MCVWVRVWVCVDECVCVFMRVCVRASVWVSVYVCSSVSVWVTVFFVFFCEKIKPKIISQMRGEERVHNIHKFGTLPSPQARSCEFQ